MDILIDLNHIFDVIPNLKMTEKTEVLVFDLFNTLIEIKDNRHFFSRLYGLSNNGFNVSTNEYRNLLLNTPIEGVFNVLPDEFEIFFNENISSLEAELNSTRLFEDSISVLEKLREQYTIILISNIASPYKKTFYDLGLDTYFEKVIFSCDVGLIKPEIQIFRIAENYSGKSGKQIMMIGDSEKSDINGAKKMNWKHVKISRKEMKKSKYTIVNLYSLNDEIATYDKI